MSGSPSSSGDAQTALSNQVDLEWGAPYRLCLDRLARPSAQWRERILAELGSAPEKGRVGGNPGLRKHYPEPIAEVLHAGNRGYCEKFHKDGLHLLSTVRQFQLRRPWENIVRIINSRHPGAKTWTVERLRRATARFVKDWLPDRSTAHRPRRKTTASLRSSLASRARHPG